MSKILLVDENELIKFLNKWKPELNDDEVLLLGLAIRGKYCPGIEKSGMFVNSIIIKEGSIEEIIMKIRRMAYVDRCYISQKTGKYINSECMVMYIDLEPRSSIKAMNELFKQYNDELVLNAFGLKDKNYRNLKRYLSWSKIRSVLAKNKSRRLYCDIDIDIKDEILLNEILHIVSKLNNKICIETKNGYHIVIPNEKKIVAELYEKYKNIEEVEIHNKQVQIPIPGTLQGGFKVRLIE